MRSAVQLFELVKYKTACDLKAEAERTYLGVVWWVLEPLLFMAVYYFVFGVLLQIRTGDFVVFLLAGIVFFQWFMSSVSQGQRAILDNKNLCRMIAIQKIIFPCISVIKSLFKFMFGIILLAIFLLFFHYTFNIYYFYVPLLMGLELLLILGVTLILSAIVPFIPDFANFVLHAMRMLFYCSGIFYTSEIIPEKYVSYFFLNPLAVFIHSYRNVLLYEKPPEYTTQLYVWGVISILLCCLGSFLIFRFDPVYAKRIYK